MKPPKIVSSTIFFTVTALPVNSLTFCRTLVSKSPDNSTAVVTVAVWLPIDSL